MAHQGNSIPRRVLVVDDEESSRTLLKEYFEILGLEVLAVSSGAECIRKLDQQGFGLVVCDISMPGMDGFEVFDKVHNLHPSQKFLFISGYTFADARKGYLQKSLGLLHKPFHLNDLNQVVGSVFPDL
jgi:CheY-like chemotaxis protein